VSEVLYLNTSRGPFTDVKVRQAFQSATDPASAVKVAFFGTLKPADNVLGPQTQYYDPSVAKLLKYDLAKANKLLDEAGWTQKNSDGIRTKDGKTLTVDFVYDPTTIQSSDVTLFQAIQFQVKKAGFLLKLDPVDSGAFTDRTNNNQYDVVNNYYVRAEPDILRTVFLSSYAPPKGANYSVVKSLDAKLLEAVGAPDAKRQQLYSDIQHEIIEQAYVVPLYVPAYQLGISKKVHGVSWATNAKPNFYDVWLSH
jgi:peptide/nickel transport system substrate-binding protein